MVSVSDYALSPLSKLVKLDLRDTVLTSYESGVFGGLHSLRGLYADDYRLCCPFFHPDQSVLSQCLTPRDELSSCDDLLQNNFFRVFLWLLSDRKSVV